jgi:hypothetical protein
MNLDEHGIILRHPRFFAQWAYPALEKHNAAFLWRWEPVEVHSKSMQWLARLELKRTRGGFTNFAKSIYSELMLENNSGVVLALHPSGVDNEFVAFDWLFTTTFRIVFFLGSTDGDLWRPQFHRFHQLKNGEEAGDAILGCRLRAEDEYGPCHRISRFPPRPVRQPESWRSTRKKLPIEGRIAPQGRKPLQLPRLQCPARLVSRTFRTRL